MQAIRTIRNGSGRVVAATILAVILSPGQAPASVSALVALQFDKIVVYSQQAVGEPASHPQVLPSVFRADFIQLEREKGEVGNPPCQSLAALSYKVAGGRPQNQESSGSAVSVDF